MTLVVDRSGHGALPASIAALGLSAAVTDGADATRVDPVLRALVAAGMVVGVAGRGRVPPGAVGLRDDLRLLRWVRRLGARAGIGPGLVAVVAGPDGCPALDGILRLRVCRAAPEELADLLEDLRERRPWAVPGIDLDPTWVVPLGLADTPLSRVDESLGATADGRTGTRGSREEDGAESDELVLVAGAWTDGPDPVGLPGPTWTRVDLASVPAASRRLFDCRTGMLWRQDDGEDGVDSIRFAALGRPGTVALRLRGPVAGDGGPPLRAPAHLPDGVDSTVAADGRSATTRSGPATIAAVADQAVVHDHDHGTRLDRVVALGTGPGPDEALAAARASLHAATEVGVDRLVSEQRRAWAARWREADVRVCGDEALTLAVRFAVHHLLASSADHGEAPVAARGLTGRAYAGHVFWDADVFVLPALAAIDPRRSRAMLDYRLARLPAARAAARAAGLDGAWFPWESAATGRDVTPRVVRDPDGAEVEVLTGRLAVHISADVAWAAVRHAAWTGDRAWLVGPGRDLVVEPARFWAARIEVDPDGSAHLRGVMGPDEYHGPVDDDVYTNVLARWNLRTAAALVAADTGRANVAERRRWLELADRLVVRRDVATGRHEQFAGFDDLEPLLISTVAELPVAADVLLGRERVAGSQVVKQPDVLMAHHVLPGELPAGSLAADLDHEGPRLAHGSSLSPAIVAGLLARDGRPDAGLPLLRTAARLDLDDVTGTTAGGLHLAAMGGLWQAIVGGFAGVEATPDALVVAPHLPEAWDGLDVTVRFHGQRVGVRVRRDHVVLVTTGDVPVRVGVAQHPMLVRGRRRIDLAHTRTPTEVTR